MSNCDFKVGDRVEYKYDIHAETDYGTVTRVENEGPSGKLRVWAIWDSDRQEQYVRPDDTGDSHLIFRVIDRPEEPVVDKPVEPSYDYVRLFKQHPELTKDAVRYLIDDSQLEEAIKLLASLK